MVSLGALPKPRTLQTGNCGMLFHAKVLNGAQLIEIDVHAHDAQEATSQLKAKGLTLVALSQPRKSTFAPKKGKFPLNLFSQELLTLLRSGLNLVEAIEALALKVDETQTVLQALLQSLQQGKSFSAALERQSDTFPLLFISTVSASERTGDLHHALERYINYENQVHLLKKKVVSASIYPLLLIGVGGMVILFLLGFVVPKFSAVYEGTGADLPWMSQVMLDWGGLISRHGDQMLWGVAVLVVGLLTLFQQTAFRAWLMQWIWKIPAVGEKLQLYQLARFYRTLGMLLRGGTPIMAALSSVSGLLDRKLAGQMQMAQKKVSEGSPLSQALHHARLTTPIGERMLLVGERGGNIADMMERIADFYDEELARWIDWFTRLFEPILMLVIGLVIGVVVLLLYMPIFELAGQIQ